jgi:uncharacterized protein
MSDVQIRNVPERGRYEAKIGDELVGYSVYELSDSVISFTYARVYTDFGGQGIASQLARISLDDARADGSRTVRPVCSFYVWFIDQYPEYADLLAS